MGPGGGDATRAKGGGKGRLHWCGWCVGEMGGHSVTTSQGVDGGWWAGCSSAPTHTPPLPWALAARTSRARVYAAATRAWTSSSTTASVAAGPSPGDHPSPSLPILIPIPPPHLRPSPSPPPDRRARRRPKGGAPRILQ